MATWQHLRSSTANKRPTTSLADGRIAINTNTASPGLFFKDSAGTRIVKVGPVHVGTTAPNSVPASGGSSGNYTGEQWLDTSVSPAQMKVWNGSTWVGIVADELPVSKLQDGAARQLIQTDAAGTGVEWTSNVDVPGTLDVTSTATFDSIAQHPLGTAGAPTIAFTGDTNTGIYSPGADQVAISTNGVQRINIEADGDINIDSGGVFYDATNNRLAIGTISPSQLLTVSGGRISIDNAQAYSAKDSGGVDRNLLQINAGNSTLIGTVASSSRFLLEGTGTGEAARIDSSGRLLVGTSTSSGDNCALQIRNDSGINAELFRASANNGGPYLELSKSRGTAASPAVVESGDRIGSIAFRGYSGAAAGYLNGAFIEGFVDGEPDTSGDTTDLPGRLVFSTTADGASSPTERMRITSSGQLLVGTSSAVNNADLQAANSISVGGTIKREVSKRLNLADNTSTTLFTFQIPGGSSQSHRTYVGGEISYIVAVGRETSSRNSRTTYGKVYFSIDRFWESNANNPVSVNLIDTDKSRSTSNGSAPTITWAITTDAGIDNAAKNAYLAITVDNPFTGTIQTNITGAISYHTLSFSDVTLS